MSESISSSTGLAAGISLSFIRWYQRWLSPWIGTQCRFQPTCSRYTYQAITQHGFFRGWGMGVYRILRCNPLSAGGDDPVPAVKSNQKNESTPVPGGAAGEK